MNKEIDKEKKNPIISGIGGQLREIRRQKGLTIQELSDATNVSKGMLSKIENGRTVPSLSTLSTITAALNIDLSHFFNNIESNNSFKYILRKKTEYKEIEKEDRQGFLYKLIHSQPVKDFVIETVVLEIKPGAKRERVTTDAYEYKYILEGEVVYVIGDDEIPMEAGDSILFDGRIPHLPVNISSQKTVMLVVYFLFSDDLK